MADKSVLSLKGEIQWASGNYQGVINDTKRMVMQHNQAISGEIKNGRRERERDFKRSLDNIEEIEKQSADSLVKNKQNVAQRLTATRLEQRTAPKLADDATSEMKKRAKGVDDLIKTAERGHSRIKKMLKDTGADVYKGTTFEKDAGAFGAATDAQKGVVIQKRKEAIDEIDEEIAALEKLKSETPYHGERTLYLAIKKDIEKLNQEREEQVGILKVEQKIKRSSEPLEKSHQEQMKESGRVRKRLYAENSEMARLEMQMEREGLQMHKNVAEEIGRIKEDVGTGLRNAFTYATVAIGAFWYKLSPVV